MIKLEDATAEEILQDASYWEDPDQALLIQPTRTGVFLMCPGSYTSPEVTSPTLREALIEYMIKKLRNCKGFIDFDMYRIDWEAEL